MIFHIKRKINKLKNINSFTKYNINDFSLFYLMLIKVLVIAVVIFIFLFVDNFINLHNIIQKVILTEYPASWYWFCLLNLHFDNMRLWVIIYYNWNLLLYFSLCNLRNGLLKNISYLNSYFVINLSYLIYDIFFS